MRSEGIAPPILKLVSKWTLVMMNSAILLPKIEPVPIVQEAGWASESLWEKSKSSCSCRGANSVVQLVAL
jgi:hypothetical protein